MYFCLTQITFNWVPFFNRFFTCITSCWKVRLDSALPITQVAYRKSRSTTERTISSTDEIVYLLLLDMSKAIDNIQRNTLIEDRKNVLNQDKLHFIQYLLDVEIAAKSGIYKSWFFINIWSNTCLMWKSQSNLKFAKAGFSIRTQKNLKEIVQGPVSLLFTYSNNLVRLLPM